MRPALPHAVFMPGGASTLPDERLPHATKITNTRLLSMGVTWLQCARQRRARMMSIACVSRVSNFRGT